MKRPMTLLTLLLCLGGCGGSQALVPADGGPGDGDAAEASAPGDAPVGGASDATESNCARLDRCCIQYSSIPEYVNTCQSAVSSHDEAFCGALLKNPDHVRRFERCLSGAAQGACGRLGACCPRLAMADRTTCESYARNDSDPDCDELSFGLGCEGDAGTPGPEGCVGPNPSSCHFGSAGGVCDHVAHAATCVSGDWVCTDEHGTPLIKGSLCGCFATTANACRCVNGIATCGGADAGRD